MHSCAFGHMLFYIKFLGSEFMIWQPRGWQDWWGICCATVLLFGVFTVCSASAETSGLWWPAGGRLGRGRTLGGGGGCRAEGLSRRCRKAKACAGSSRGGRSCCGGGCSGGRGGSRHSTSRSPSRLLSKKGSWQNIWRGYICRYDVTLTILHWEKASEYSSTPLNPERQHTHAHTHLSKLCHWPPLRQWCWHFHWLRCWETCPAAFLLKEQRCLLTYLQHINTHNHQIFMTKIYTTPEPLSHKS